MAQRPGRDPDARSINLGISPRRENKVKAIKMIGLTALAAPLAMAFVGASSAMAESTSLCSVDENPCALANQLGSVHEMSVGKAQLLTSVGTFECDVLFSGTIAMKLANPLVISGSFAYMSCVLGGSNCTVTEINKPAEIKVLKEGHETARVTFKYQIHIVCAGFIDCTYNGESLNATGKGPLLSAQVPDGEASIQEQSLTKVAGGFLCPKTAKLDITTTPLVATYISS